MVWFCFPSTTASSSAYLALLVAWSAADVVRYVYLALHLWGLAPGELVWLRYVELFLLCSVYFNSPSCLIQLDGLACMEIFVFV